MTFDEKRKLSEAHALALSLLGRVEALEAELKRRKGGRPRKEREPKAPGDFPRLLGVSDTARDQVDI